MGNNLGHASKDAGCCAGDEDTGTLEVALRRPQACKRRPCSDEATSETVIGELQSGVDSLHLLLDNVPETSHPAGVNTFDELARLHVQIQQQLSEQEALIQKVLCDGESLELALDAEVDDGMWQSLVVTEPETPVSGPPAANPPPAH
eukprot:NODE_15808_length_1029_cov_5.036585.p2 GENE.NODE_15808_length_1029_cov_5.036585~~NODE_15808_length_1029_cov_5.036585.p2  ORF type:complete len:147 (-),score=37.98 NODE_15808_length_1029_cov_5.036585:447-887(-)